MKSRSAQIVHVDVDRPLTDVHVADGYTHVMVIVHAGDSVVGHFRLPARPRIPAEELWATIAWRMGDVIWRQRMRQALRRVARAADGAAAVSPPTVSVIVCTRDRPDHLRPCLESLARLRTPHEIVVVDNAPSDGATRELCADFPVRYVLEPLPGQTRARNRGIVESSGEIVAFTDDDCVPDPGWLDDLGGSFGDPLVMAVTGYVGPLELEHTSQYVFEQHGGFDRHPEPWILDPATIDPLKGASIAGAGANMLFRREVFEHIGLFAEDLGPGTPARAGDDKYAFYRVLAAGYRIAYEPSRIIWHRHRQDWAGLVGALSDYGIAEFAYTTRCLVKHREPGALRIWRYWAQHYRREAQRTLRRRSGRIPLALTASEVRGAVRGPWRLLASKRSRRQTPPIELSPKAEPDGRRPTVEVGHEAPSLSVAIASRNRSAMLCTTLEALAVQHHRAESFEVVVVLDGGTDDSAAAARGLELPYTLRVIEQDHLGRAITRNRSVREARNDIVVFLDDDVVPTTGFVAAHAAAHRAGSPDDLVLGYCPPVIERDGLWSILVRNWWEDHYHCKSQPGHLWSFTDITSGNLSLPRTRLVELGGYDEQFANRREDWELGARLLSAGLRPSFRGDAIGRHHLDLSFPIALRNRREEGRDDIHLAMRHPDLMAQLPFVRVAVNFERRPRKTALALEAARRMDIVTEPALATLDALEAARMRGRWHRLATRLLLRAYLAGLLDAISDVRELRRFLAPAARRQADATVALWLDRPGSIELPVGGARTVDFAVGHSGRSLATVAAVAPGGQFDWRTFTERAVWETGEPARLALAMLELDRTPDR